MCDQGFFVRFVHVISRISLCASVQLCVCVCACVCLCLWCLLELIAKAMTSQVVVAALGMNRHGIEYHWQ